MRAIILAAGKGRRLGEITRRVPKPMLRVKDEIILEHNIRWLKRCGIKDIYITLHHLPHVIKKYFSDGKRLGIEIRYSYEPEIIGTAGAVKRIIKQCWKKEKLADDAFLVIYGDNFYPPNL